MKAEIWRGLMAVGMYFHHFPRPHPPKAAFTVSIPSRLGQQRGYFKLVFYVPSDYFDDKNNPDKRYPVVVNYHGGGFTIGKGTDDARWARAVTENSDAVLVSVAYRLAPKYAFSVGVEDCTDAVIYLAAHAQELRLDPHRMALSGFSAGGNFALTVPLMLRDLLQDNGRRSLKDQPGSLTRTASNKSTMSMRRRRDQGIDDDGADVGHCDAGIDKDLEDLPTKQLEPSELEIAQKMPEFTIRTIVAFYPPTDFRIPRAEKRLTNPRPEFNLPPTLTNLFDESYLDSERTSCHLDLADPYLSPMAATDDELREAYPESIIMYTCEYDMLNAEGVAFGERLKSPAIGKHVSGGMIHAVPHAFDKKPNPVKFPESAKRCYGEATAELSRVFGIERWNDSQDLQAAARQLDKSENVKRFAEIEKIDHLEPGETSEQRKLHRKSLAQQRAQSPDPPSGMANL